MHVCMLYVCVYIYMSLTLTYQPSLHLKAHVLHYPPRSLVHHVQTSPHKPRLVASHSTCLWQCPRLSLSPHANSFVIGTAVMKNNIPAIDRTENVPRLQCPPCCKGAISCVCMCVCVCVYECVCVCVCSTPALLQKAPYPVVCLRKPVSRKTFFGKKLFLFFGETGDDFCDDDLAFWIMFQPQS